MLKITVDLPDGLFSAVEEAGVPVSAVCQAALSQAVDRVAQTRRTTEALRDPATSAATFRKLAEGFRTPMNPRLVASLQLAAAGADQDSRVMVSSIDLLRGILSEGDNVAVRLLVDEGVDVNSLLATCKASRCTEPGTSCSEPRWTLLERLTMPARSACAASLEAVVELGHNYLGCEHLLVGLTASDTEAAELLSEYGVRATSGGRRTSRSKMADGVGDRNGSSSQAQAEQAKIARRLDVIERQLTNLDEILAILDGD